MAWHGMCRRDGRGDGSPSLALASAMERVVACLMPAACLVFLSRFLLRAAPSSSHPLDRTGGNEGGAGGALRHNRRGDRSAARRDEPYGRPSRDAGYSSGPVAVRQRVVGDTVRVSNLDSRLSEEDLRYVFEKVGTIQKVSVFYTQSGAGTGTAEVQFASNAAAENAVRQLDQAEVDGRIMYVQIVGQVVQTPVVQRRRDAPREDDRRAPRESGRDGRRDGGRQQQQQSAPRQAGPKAPRAPRPEKKEANAVDLDAELDSYHSSKPAAAAAAPAAEAAPVPAAAEATSAPME